MAARDLTALGRIASEQDGLFSLAQAVDAGVDRRVVQRAAHAGVIAAIGSGVFHFVATPIDHRRRIRAAVMAVGGVSRASHESCLHLHDVIGIELDRPVVVVPPLHRASHDAIRVHRFRDDHPEHHALVDGIPTFTLARAIVDVSSVFSSSRMEHVIDQVTITKRQVSLGAVARAFRQVNHRGRQNIGMLDGILDERLALGSVDRSTLERAVDELIALTDLPRPLKEFPVPSLAPGEGFADRAWEDAKLILEIDGRTHHERRRAMRRDRARDRAAAVMGWHTARVLDEEVRLEPDLVLDDIVAIHRQRMDQLHGGVG